MLACLVMLQPKSPVWVNPAAAIQNPKSKIQNLKGV
jgi:hypothetical protein